MQDDYYHFRPMPLCLHNCLEIQATYGKQWPLPISRVVKNGVINFTFSLHLIFSDRIIVCHLTYWTYQLQINFIKHLSVLFQRFDAKLS